MIDTFEQCKQVSELLSQGFEAEARNALIILLQTIKDNNNIYNPLINHLIRETGLYPYIDTETSSWQERFLVEAFKVDIGGGDIVTLHREQSAILSSLLKEEDLAVSAPTSFGKSFIIDAFIAMKKPTNVVIIVPTLALADETRRRLYHKFSADYNIITTTRIELCEKNLFIFPQERALSYVDLIPHIDLLIVDEFYKAGKIHGEKGEQDERRAAQLIEAISRLSKKTKQRYFLAPNITELKENPLTKGMRFEKIDFNTVYTSVVNVYETIVGNKQEKKEQKYRHLKQILTEEVGKTLVYVNSYNSIQQVTSSMLEIPLKPTSEFLTSFSLWIKENYGRDYVLAKLVERGIGIHNGQLHRSLAQLQIKLFERDNGLNYLVSTSSLIEGVNTSARNVIIWSNKSANTKYDYFTYKNIVGRSGRMFRHFVGKVFVLEAPPQETKPSLELGFTDVLLERINPQKYTGELTTEQIAKIRQHELEMDGLLGEGGYRQLIEELDSQGVSKSILRDIIYEMSTNPKAWRNLKSLLDSNPQKWTSALYLIAPLLRKVKYFNGKDGRVVRFIQRVSRNWNDSIPNILKTLNSDSIRIEDFFELERMISFDLVSLLHSINVLSKRVLGTNIDISPFIVRISNAFLPSNVFALEEFGLPRMLSRKIQNSRIIDLESNSLSINQVLDRFNSIGEMHISSILELSNAERFILSNFFEGITPSPNA